MFVRQWGRMFTFNKMSRQQYSVQVQNTSYCTSTSPIRLYGMVLRRWISYFVVCLNKLKLNTKTCSGEPDFITEIMKIPVKSFAENEIYIQLN